MFYTIPEKNYIFHTFSIVLFYTGRLYFNGSNGFYPKKATGSAAGGLLWGYLLLLHHLWWKKNKRKGLSSSANNVEK